MKVGDRVKRIFGREPACDQIFRRNQVYTVCAVFHFGTGDDVRFENVEGTFSAVNFQLECKFKVGDRVVRTAPAASWPAGQVYVIEALHPHNTYIGVHLAGVPGTYELGFFSAAPPEAPDPMRALMQELAEAQAATERAQARFNAYGPTNPGAWASALRTPVEISVEKKIDPKRLGVAPRRIK